MFHSRALCCLSLNTAYPILFGYLPDLPSVSGYDIHSSWLLLETGAICSHLPWSFALIHTGKVR